MPTFLENQFKLKILDNLRFALPNLKMFKRLIGDDEFKKIFPFDFAIVNNDYQFKLLSQTIIIKNVAFGQPIAVYDNSNTEVTYDDLNKLYKQIQKTI